MKPKIKFGHILPVAFLSGCATIPKEPPRNIDRAEYTAELNSKNITIIQHPKPYFPMKAYREHQQGWCIAKFDIDEQGIPINIEIIDCSPEGYFEEACRIQTRQYRYSPEEVPAKNMSNRCVYRIKSFN